jgi:hypothetical protein
LVHGFVQGLEYVFGFVEGEKGRVEFKKEFFFVGFEAGDPYIDLSLEKFVF